MLLALATSTPAFSAEKTPVDVQKELIQKTLDSKELGIYFHEDLPGRVPVVILDNGVVDTSVAPKKFGKPVLFKTKDEIRSAQTKAYLVITRIVVAGDRATIGVEYPIEGVFGEIKFTKTDKGWIEKGSLVYE